jgi:hypothetical protein
MSNQTKIARKVVNLEQGTVNFIFADGTSKNVELDTLPEAIIRQAALHGLAQKLGDCYAAASDKAAEERMEPVDWAKQEFDAVLAAILQGEWNRKRQGGSGLTVQALAEATGATLEEAMAAWSGMDEERQKAVRKHPAFKEAYLRLKQEALQQAAANAKPLTL